MQWNLVRRRRGAARACSKKPRAAGTTSSTPSCRSPRATRPCKCRRDLRLRGRDRGRVRAGQHVRDPVPSGEVGVSRPAAAGAFRSDLRRGAFRVVTMQLWPAIDIRAGRCVRLLRGEFSAETVYGDPLEQARAFVSAGASRLHVVDLDAARQGARRTGASCSASPARRVCQCRPVVEFATRSPAAALLDAGGGTRRRRHGGCRATGGARPHGRALARPGARRPRPSVSRRARRRAFGARWRSVVGWTRAASSLRPFCGVSRTCPLAA